MFHVAYSYYTHQDCSSPNLDTPLPNSNNVAYEIQNLFREPGRVLDSLKYFHTVHTGFQAVLEVSKQSGKSPDCIESFHKV